MILTGKIIKIVSEGYERCINIRFDDDSIGSLWCYLVDTEEYIEPGCQPIIMEVEKSVKVKLSIDWVTSYTLVGGGKEISFKQTIHESSHVEVTADVAQVIDEYTVECNIGNLTNVIVEFESKRNDINVGDRISFGGNLKAEVIQQ
jgi:hypothetical protein